MKDEKKGIFAFIKNMHGDNESAFAKFMKDATFQIPAPQVLVNVITGLDELYENDVQNQDMLDKLSASGQNGQFRTPAHKSKFAVQKSLEKAETLYKSLMQRYFA